MTEPKSIRAEIGHAESFGWLKRGDLSDSELDYWEAPSGEIYVARKGEPVFVAKNPGWIDDPNIKPLRRLKKA